MGVFSLSIEMYIQCVPEKRKPINQVNLSENCNELSKMGLHCYKIQLINFLSFEDVLVMHGWARTIWNGDVKIDLRRIG